MTAGNQKSTNLTDEQMACVLERIASALDLASDICRREAIRFDGHDSSYSFLALEPLLSSMGALADRAGREDVVGDMYSWFCGPNFYSQIEATQKRT